MVHFTAALDKLADFYRKSTIRLTDGTLSDCVGHLGVWLLSWFAQRPLRSVAVPDHLQSQTRTSKLF